MGVLFFFVFSAFPSATFGKLSNEEREAGSGIICFFGLCEFIMEAFIIITII